MESFFYYLKKIIPKPILGIIMPPYHFALAFLSALYYRFPSKHLFVIGVTGTKGKTTTVEILNALLEHAGYRTAVASTLRFKVGGDSSRNMRKMTMPGRFFLQGFLRSAIHARANYVIIEMTSEGAKQFRHAFIDLNALVFTNLSPEHIESHGSYERYRDAKLKIARSLERSQKKEKMIIANADDEEGEKFLSIRVEKKFPYSFKDASPVAFHENGTRFVFDGVPMETPLQGEFNLLNIIAAATCAKALGIKTTVLKSAIENFRAIPGRLEFIREGQPFDVVVDYAHTPDSLEKIYQVFKEKRKICVLGATGGGRDKWKREKFGEIAHTYCEEIVLTNEDPYDEDPQCIVDEIESGIMKRKEPAIVCLDRRKAIQKGFELAKPGDIVLITGKGTDPYIMGPRGEKTPWDDRDVAREELRKITNLQSKI